MTKKDQPAFLSPWQIFKADLMPVTLPTIYNALVIVAGIVFIRLGLITDVLFFVGFGWVLAVLALWFQLNDMIAEENDS